MGMTLSIFEFFAVVVMGQTREKCFTDWHSSFYLFIQPLSIGKTKTIFAKTVKNYQEIYFGFYLQTVEKRRSEITQFFICSVIVNNVLLFIPK